MPIRVNKFINKELKILLNNKIIDILLDVIYIQK